MMKNVVEWLIENWFLLIVAVALIVVVYQAIKTFIQMPNSKQKAKILKCLLGWVVEAERELGGGTGKVKLSTVYGMFVTAFPIVKNFISFETFSDWVDDALEEMRVMIENNKNLKEYVESPMLIREAIAYTTEMGDTSGKE